jgi:glycosyltransferase involved in cell wall biosynthesis
MRILFLAPQPFYQERGTPIAVKALLELLARRGEEVDVLTYHLGENVDLDRVSIQRTPNIPFIRSIRPGFSPVKLLCDGFLFVKALWTAGKRQHQLVYAVEEAVYIALILKILFRLPYVYDMDSSLPQQLMEKYGFLRVFGPIFNWFEGLAVNHATAVVPVCDALVNLARQYRPQYVTALYDVPILYEEGDTPIEDVRQQLGLSGTVAMYVGNLESYQGIDLLLESFVPIARKSASLHLVVIGGSSADIEKYQDKARRLGIEFHVHFMGPKPVQQLAGYLAQADILVSSRIRGENTPMKIYSYLASGKPILATDLRTHTQVLTEHVSMLITPTPECLAEGLLCLANNRALGLQLGEAGKQLVESKYNYAAFANTVSTLMTHVATAIGY